MKQGLIDGIKAKSYCLEDDSDIKSCWTIIWTVLWDEYPSLWGFPGSSAMKKSASAADAGLTPGSGRSLEKEMVTQSSILVWETPWTEEPCGLQSIESQRVGHNWVTKHHTHSSKDSGMPWGVRTFSALLLMGAPMWSEENSFKATACHCGTYLLQLLSNWVKKHICILNSIF